MRLSDQAGTYSKLSARIQTPPTSHLAPCQRPSGRSIRPKRSSLPCETERPIRSIGYNIPTSPRSCYGPRTDDSRDCLQPTYRKPVHPKLPSPENPHQTGSTQTLAMYPGEALNCQRPMSHISIGIATLGPSTPFNTKAIPS
jgi:hypothetical protein